MSRYVLGEEAELDLDSVWEFIARDNIEAADRWIARRYAEIDSLAKMPGMGHSRVDITNASVRFWPVGAYLIVYRVRDELIQIVPVTQGSRDIPTFLSQRLG